MSENKNKILASNLRAERSRKKYTQEKLAELSGVSVSTISLIEREKQTPSIHILMALAKALEIDMSELLKGL